MIVSLAEYSCTLWKQDTATCEQERKRHDSHDATCMILARSWKIRNCSNKIGSYMFGNREHRTVHDEN